jgi:hypothetical protein
MANKHGEFFHDKWLGHVQTESDGLVVAKPVLLDANCAQTQPPSVQETLRELCPQTEDDSQRRIENLARFFEELLDLDASLFDTATEIAEDVSLYAPEGPQTLRPTFGLLHQDAPEPIEGTGTPASNAAAKYVALIWDVTAADDNAYLEEALGLSLDKPETITGEWSYPPAAKFDRLLRHCRVPVGIITNREVIRLVYAPHGASSGHITFRIEDMATVGGRPILDAMIMLLNANQWFGVSDESTLPLLMKRSREHQGSVTEDLAEQVFSGLEALLQGFQQAAERDGSDLLQEALEQDDDHLYRGLLTVMLRLVFILYAEDRSLLPVEHPLYAKRMSLLGLFERLQRDHGNFPDSMNNRFGAWGHIVSLCRAIYLGVDHGDFHIPPRHGELFDPHRFKFLEGWTGDSAPVITQKARSEVQVPTVDDGTVFNLLRSLLIFQGQRLSYRTLDVEQIGSVYEALMGYHVDACKSQAVAIKINSKKGTPKYWLEPQTLQAIPAAQRLRWLQNDCGFDKGTATKIKQAVDAYEKAKPEERGALIEALAPLAPGKKDKSVWKLAKTGQYILQPGAERRRSGSHYTPRSLTSPIVQKTLQPLLRCLGNTPTAEQILELKLCDPAMGSGAFLVECCRQLADEVVAAWGRNKQVEEIATLCPEGDVVAHARRLVAQRCLYGVDKNVMAVQLAKLSLWLFTLARELPFTFLDHSLRYGDSLVGLDFEQIKAFHWKPEKQISFLEEEINKALDEVVAIRQEIHALAGDASPEGQKLKAQRLFDANDAIEKVRKIADICIGAFFAHDKNKPRLEERQRREDIVRAWLNGDVGAEISFERWVKEIRDLHAPFHWWLEFPEVFYKERVDPLSNGGASGVAHLDGLVGNPPFIDGKMISGSFGDSYKDWLKELHIGSLATADFCSQFLRRADVLLGSQGVMGFITTKTIAEGTTRETGLEWLTLHGHEIYFAESSFDWPGAAAVVAAKVCLAKGNVAVRLMRRELNEAPVDYINSSLTSGRPKPNLKKLDSNRGIAHVGVDMNCTNEFLLSSDQKDLLIEKNIDNSKYIKKFVTGDEVTERHNEANDRFAIMLTDLTLDEADKYPDLLNIVRRKVKPLREELTDTPDGKRLKSAWWKYNRSRNEMRASLKNIKKCIVMSRHTKYCVFSFQSTEFLYSDGTCVFVSDSLSFWGILQSRIHDFFARKASNSSLGRTLRYKPPLCFSTFPFPNSNPLTEVEGVLRVAILLENLRNAILLDRNIGLTDLYNLLSDNQLTDNEVLSLRSLHENLDRVVLDAYGWSDIEVPPYCPGNKVEEADIEAFNNEVINRLYVLNAERAAEEERLSMTKAFAKKRTIKKTAEPNPTLDLF